MKNIKLASLTDTNINRIDENSQDDIFEFLYLYNKKVFQSYKYKNLPSLTTNLYGLFICNWIIEKLKEIGNREIDYSDEILPYVISNFSPFVDTIINNYGILTKMNITNIHFFTLNEETNKKDCDFCLQIDLTTGIGYFENVYRFIPNCLVYFIEFSFDYVNEVGVKSNILLRDIAEPFLDLIEP